MIRPLLLLLSVATLAHASPRRHVIVVGHNGAIDDKRPPLRFADDDAARFYELLSPGAASAHLLTVLDPESQQLYPELVEAASPPTPHNVNAAITSVREALAKDAAAGQESEVFWVYAGHGQVEGGEGFVGLEGGRLTRATLRQEVIEGLPAARVHVIIDACKSYFLVRDRGPGGEATPYRARFAAPKAPPGVGFVLSTSSDADSHEWAALPGGVFSHEVRSGLLGAADVSGDGAVDYEELAAFVGLANAGLPAGRFRPQVFIQPPRADARATLVRADLETATRLELEGPRTGRVTVLDERGLRYLDTHKAPGATLTLSLLAPRRYEVRLGESRWTLTADGAPRRLAELDSGVTTIASRNVAHEAFEQLFAEPFGAATLAGFRVGRLQITDPVERADPESDWITPTLVVGGVTALGAGLGLGLWSADTRVEAGDAPQANRPGLIDRADGLEIAAWTAIGVGATALAVATWRWLAD